MPKLFILTVAFGTAAILAGCSVEAEEKQPTDLGASSQAIRAGRDIEAPPPGSTDGRGEGDPTPTSGAPTGSGGCGEDGRLCPNPAPAPSPGGCGEGGRLCPSPAR